MGPPFGEKYECPASPSSGPGDLPETRGCAKYTDESLHYKHLAWVRAEISQCVHVASHSKTEIATLDAELKKYKMQLWVFLLSIYFLLYGYQVGFLFNLSLFECFYALNEIKPLSPWRVVMPREAEELVGSVHIQLGNTFCRWSCHGDILGRHSCDFASFYEIGTV